MLIVCVGFYKFDGFAIKEKIQGPYLMYPVCIQRRRAFDSVSHRNEFYELHVTLLQSSGEEGILLLL